MAAGVTTLSLLTANPRRATAGWVLYDLANTIFALGVTGYYLAEWMTATDVADSWLSVTQSAAAALVAVLGPWLGARSDHSGRRIPLLALTTAVAVLATTALTGWSTIATFLALGVALIAINSGSVVYDALLPQVSTPLTRSRVSGLGVGFGYLGSFVGLAIGAVFLDVLEVGYHLTFIGLAAGFLIFSIPVFVWVREQPAPLTSTRPPPVLRMLSVLLQSWRSSRDYPGLTRFLVGRFLYTDAINTLVGGFLTVFAIEELHLDRAGSRGLLIAAIVGAMVGGLGGGRVAERFGSKRVLRWALLTWAGAIAAAVISATFDSSVLIPMIGPLGGIALGATWATDRVLMTELTPRGRLGEFYGLYATVGRFATILGPLIWGLSVDVLDWGRVVAISILGGFIIAGWWVVGGVHPKSSAEFDHA